MVTNNINENTASASNSKLQNILQNGKLAYLQDSCYIFSYEFKDDIKKLVRFIRLVDIPNEPRIQFSGEYDIFIGRYLKIRSNITGNFNKYEIGYIYAAPILLADDFPTDLAEKMIYDDICLYNEKDVVKVPLKKDGSEVVLGDPNLAEGWFEARMFLNFERLLAFFVGILHDNEYLDGLFQVDQDNRIIYFGIPIEISNDEFNKFLNFGREKIELSKSAETLIIENSTYKYKKRNLASFWISCGISSFLKHRFATHHYKIES